MISELLLADSPLVTYVGFIGTRKISDERAKDVRENAAYAAQNEYHGISGGAVGTDTIAEKEFKYYSVRFNTYTPRSMDTVRELDEDFYRALYEVAKECHPNWSAVIARGPYVVDLMVRNVVIVLRSDIVLAWPSPDRKGGTEHGIRVAKYLRKPLDIRL